jgi:hypothetical protein
MFFGELVRCFGELVMFFGELVIKKRELVMFLGRGYPDSTPGYFGRPCM